MARPIRSIEIYLPLDYNDGRPIPESKYISLQQELLHRFSGVTSVQRPFPLQGVWQSGTDIYQDRIVVFSVMDFREGTQLECLRYLEKLKGRLKKKFDQLEILITVAELLAIGRPGGRLVRRYTLGPSPLVRDTRSGRSTSRLDLCWTDTSTSLWRRRRIRATNDPHELGGSPIKLSGPVATASQDPTNELLLRTATVWELAIKIGQKKLACRYRTGRGWTGRSPIWN